jgi:hypothetical protein
MTTSVSPPVRIAALVGLAAALALGGMFMLMGRKSASSASPAHVVIKHHPFGPGAITASPSAEVPASASTAHTRSATKAPLHVVVKPKVRLRPSAEVAALAAGLPPRVARALGQHSVVVVSLIDPQSEVDGIAFAEARAGAALSGAGFVSLNVLSAADVTKLTEKFGQTLPDPGLLVYTRPAKLAIRLDGFVDKESVAQAAQNAADGS